MAELTVRIDPQSEPIPLVVAKANSTSLIRQYLDVKEQHPDCMLFFRVGDFYEMFHDDAVVAARASGLVLPFPSATSNLHYEVEQVGAIVVAR